MEKRKLTCRNASAFLRPEPCSYGGPIPPVSFLPVSLETGFFIYVSASASSSDVATACSAGIRIMTPPHFLTQTSVPLIRISCNGEPDTFILGRVIFYAYDTYVFNSIPQFIE